MRSSFKVKALPLSPLAEASCKKVTDSAFKAFTPKPVEVELLKVSLPKVSLEASTLTLEVLAKVLLMVSSLPVITVSPAFQSDQRQQCHQIGR